MHNYLQSLFQQHSLRSVRDVYNKITDMIWMILQASSLQIYCLQCFTSAQALSISSSSSPSPSSRLPSCSSSLLPSLSCLPLLGDSLLGDLFTGILPCAPVWCLSRLLLCRNACPHWPQVYVVVVCIVKLPSPPFLTTWLPFTGLRGEVFGDDLAFFGGEMPWFAFGL